MAGYSEMERSSILSDFSISQGELPVRYVGLPLLTKQMKKSDCLPLFERVRGNINSWTTRFLSFAGRLQLIQSMLKSIINFWLTAYRLPSECIGVLEKMCTAFLWSGPELNTNKAKVSWVEVCKMKSEGGLGIRSLKETNKVMCLKLIWRIVSRKNSLWVQWIYSNLLKNRSLWIIKDTTSLGSWMWKKLLKYRSVAEVFSKVEVQNGDSTFFWHDNWCSLGKLGQLYGRAGVYDFGIQQHSLISDVPLSRRRRNHRNVEKNVVETELAEVIARRYSNKPDSHLWRNRAGKYKRGFSTADTWFQIRKEFPNVRWDKGIWFSNSTPKFSFIQWLCYKNRLATGERMLRWNASANVGCAFCDAPMETRERLFFECKYTEEIWHSLTRGLLGVRYTNIWTSVTAMVLAGRGNYIFMFLFRYVFQASIYFIWRDRNRRRHGEKPISANGIQALIDNVVRNKISSVRRTDSRMEEALITWFEVREG